MTFNAMYENHEQRISVEEVTFKVAAKCKLHWIWVLMVSIMLLGMNLWLYEETSRQLFHSTRFLARCAASGSLPRMLATSQMEKSIWSSWKSFWFQTSVPKTVNFVTTIDHIILVSKESIFFDTRSTFWCITPVTTTPLWANATRTLTYSKRCPDFLMHESIRSLVCNQNTWIHTIKFYQSRRKAIFGYQISLIKLLVCHALVNIYSSLLCPYQIAPFSVKHGTIRLLAAFWLSVSGTIR